MNRGRESHFDLLRIICCIAVVVIHVTGTYKGAITSTTMFGELVTENISAILLCNTLVRFAVPCFVMLAGAFALSKEENGNYRFYYAKIVSGVVIPTVIFSIAYFLYVAIPILIECMQGGKSLSELLRPFVALLKGAPYYHMWYLYVVLILYILVPVILLWKKSITNNQFMITAVALTIVGVASGWSSVHNLNWDIGQSACYLGYFVLGYAIKYKFEQKQNNITGIFLVISGLLVEVLVTMIQYGHTMRGLGEVDEKYTLIGPMNPMIAIAAILIFTGFSMIRIERDFGWLAKRTFLIYLFQSGVWDQGKRIVKYISPEHAMVVIPCAVILVFGVSLLAAVVYEGLWKALDRQAGISKKACRLLRLL